MTLGEFLEKFKKNINKKGLNMKTKSAMDLVCKLEEKINKSILSSDVNTKNVQEFLYGNYSNIVSNIVIDYKNHKDNAIKVFKRINEELENQYGYIIDCDFPPISVSNTFERLMYESKKMQEGVTKDTLSKILWLDTRSIEKDINRLKGKEDPIQILGKKFVIEELNCVGNNYSSRSTVHPIFLTSNLTQVILTLRGLYQMSKDNANVYYVNATAKEIFRQLTRYAQDRIFFCLDKLFLASKDEIEWLNEISESSDETFFSEKNCTEEGGDATLDCLKNGDDAYIECKNGIFYKKVKIKSLLPNGIIIEDNKNKITLNKNDIIKVKTSLEDLVND